MFPNELFPDDLPPEDQPQPGRGPTRAALLSVWELTEQVKDLLETTFPVVWVAGEISNLARPQSGHCYLTLKDDRAQLRAVMWRSVSSRLRFDLHDGLEVICRGRLEVYAPRGSYQLVIEHVEPKGMGALELALRQLRARLAREGLFRPERKRPLPRFVRRIAVVTSPSGAAIHDFLQILGRRWRGADVLVVPSRVQGVGAAEEIAAAIETVNRLPLEIDCLVVTRGGGSLEDLWAFNEEVVVRAICASRIPVVSAIGHEIDVTLADLAADVRALTPSEAAELVAPAAEELLAQLQQARQRLSAGLRWRLAAARSRLEGLAARRAFRRPLQYVQDMTRRLDEWDARSARAVRRRLRLARRQVDQAVARLESLSPLAVLGRGYSVTRRAADGQIVRDAGQLAPAEQIVTRFAHGQATSRVEGIDVTGPSRRGTSSRGG
ncbi:MAG: exodeoxyribonuclease VII large subunit [Thermoguttaceae bacterium]|jgi:exodeoxyribonuclease VII large subunit